MAPAIPAGRRLRFALAFGTAASLMIAAFETGVGSMAGAATDPLPPDFLYLGRHLLPVRPPLMLLVVLAATAARYALRSVVQAPAERVQ
jgi:hypothetical protein